MGLPVTLEQSLAEFQRMFPDEQSCAAHLSKLRWPTGFVCPGCGGSRAVPLRSRANTYECLVCSRQTSITAGTVLDRTKLLLTLWFRATHLIATHPQGVSARHLETRLDVAYPTARLLKRKLMVRNTARDNVPLQNLVEVNRTEFFCRAYRQPREHPRPRKIIVIGALELPDDAGTPGKPCSDPRPHRIRLAVLSDNSASAMRAFIRANVKRAAILFIDGRKPDLGLPDYRCLPRNCDKTPPRTQQVFAAIKDWFGTHKELDDILVEDGIEQFAAHVNWRISFDAVLQFALSRKPMSHWDIIGRPNPRRGTPTTRRRPRRRSTATGMREDGSGPG